MNYYVINTAYNAIQNIVSLLVFVQGPGNFKDPSFPQEK